MTQRKQPTLQELMYSIDDVKKRPRSDETGAAPDKRVRR